MTPEKQVAVMGAFRGDLSAMGLRAAWAPLVAGAAPISVLTPPRQIVNAKLDRSVLSCVRIAAQAMDIPAIDILSERRHRHIVHARWLAIWLARHTTKASLPRIASRIGGRDHTTIMYGLERFEGLRAAVPELRTLSDRLRAQMLAEIAP